MVYPMMGKAASVFTSKALNALAMEHLPLLSGHSSDFVAQSPCRPTNPVHPRRFENSTALGVLTENENLMW